MQFFFQALHSGGDFRLHAVGVGIDAAAHPVRAALNARAQIGLLHVAEGFAQLGGGRALIVAGEFARGVLQIFFQAAEVVGEFLAIVGKLSAFRCSGHRSRALSEGLLNAAGLVALFLSEAAGLICERIDLCSPIAAGACCRAGRWLPSSGRRRGALRLRFAAEWLRGACRRSPGASGRATAGRADRLLETWQSKSLQASDSSVTVDTCT